jgi:hypothetical protein
MHIVWDNSTICGQMKIEREGVSWNQAVELRSLWCNFSAFIIHDRSRIFLESCFVLGCVVFSASLQYLLDDLPVVFQARNGLW